MADALPAIPPPDGNPRIAVWMSGGVDSAVAAALLQRAGYAVEAVTLRLHADDPNDPHPPELTRAQAVAEHLGVPWTELDVRAGFRARVYDPFIAAYLAGRTPSPCVGCNPTVKLGMALDTYARAHGVERFATGHYARIARRAGDSRPRLLRAADTRRDQSYFLYRLPEHTLARLLFPLGDARDKQTIRAWANALGLPSANAGDSMDLCFLPGGDYRALLPAAGTTDALTPGPIRDLDGRVVGQHPGTAYFTLGQRKGLGAHAGPRYAVATNPTEHTVTIGPREAVLRRTVHAGAPVYGVDGPPSTGERLRARVRSGGEPHPCTVLRADEQRLSVRFDVPRFAPAPGQHLVLYMDDDGVRGGGEIEAAEAE